MIRINLLKGSSRKKTVRKTARKTVAIQKPLIIAATILVLIAGGFFGWKLIPQSKPSVKIKSDEIAKPQAPVRVGPNMIEEVVREIGNDRNNIRSSKLMIPYSEMTFPEKVNYEVLFAKNVFQLLTRAIPDGIGLKNLEIEDFQTVYAVGIGDTKELISNTFLALKKEKLELLQQPYSYITANAGNGYRFVVTCKAAFGVDHGEPFQAWDYIGTRDVLPDLVKKITKIAADNQLKLAEEPSKKSVDDVGLFRRYGFHFFGTGEYKNFVAFMLALYKEKIPCAFKKIQLKAGNASLVSIEVDLLLTVKE